MKKLLIATAALAMVAGTAQAQSSVTVYGNLDVANSTSKNEGSANGTVTVNKQKNTGNGDGAFSTSILGFRGTEDLGGGTKAEFQLEYDLVDAGIGGNGNKTTSTTAADTTTVVNGAAGDVNGFGARQSWVGLSDAKLGTLRLGRQAQSIHSVVVGGSAGMGNNVAGAIYSAGMNANVNDATIRPHVVYVNRAVTYISPSFNGVTLEAQTAKQEINNGGTVSYAKETGGSLKYAAGKFAAAYGLSNIDQDTTSANTTTDVSIKIQALNASYDFGIAKLFALNTQRKETTAGALTADTKATEVGVSVPFGKTTVWASAYDGDRDGTGSTATVAGLASAKADVKGQQVGVKYDLSKRTSAYAIYGKSEIQGVTLSTTYTKTTQTSLGLKHSF